MIFRVDSIDVLTFHFLPFDFCLPPMKTSACLTIALRLALMASVSQVAFQVADCVPAWAADHQGVASWEFGTEEITRVAYSGSLQRDARGPRPPMFPDFSETNTAIKLNGDGAHVDRNGADTGRARDPRLPGRPRWRGGEHAA